MLQLRMTYGYNAKQKRQSEEHTLRHKHVSHQKNCKLIAVKLLARTNECVTRTHTWFLQHGRQVYKFEMLFFTHKITNLIFAYNCLVHFFLATFFFLIDNYKRKMIFPHLPPSASFPHSFLIAGFMICVVLVSHSL